MLVNLITQQIQSGSRFIAVCSGPLRKRLGVSLTPTPRKVVVVGTGYVGLTSGACFAHLGNRVICVDNDRHKLDGIARGCLPIFEDGLEAIVAEQLSRGNLMLTTDLREAVADAEFVFLCLPTPTQSDGSADMSILLSVVEELRQFIPPGVVVVNKSTVPVTSSEKVQRLIGSANPVIANPEFLREGSAVKDFLKPDRVVVGAIDQQAAQKVAGLYEELGAPIVLTDPVSAETIKYMANTFLATKISFVNEVARFSHCVGADVLEVLNGMSFDDRIGGQYLSPGPGWGGSCFPKDTKALLASARQVGIELPVVEHAIRSNELHFDFVLDVIRREASNYSQPVIAVLGLSFKAMTDDVRESPAIRIAKTLRTDGFTLQSYDPMAGNHAEIDTTRKSTIEEALHGAHIAVVLTEWPEFSALQPERMQTLMAGRSVIDARYVIDKPLFSASDFRVLTVG